VSSAEIIIIDAGERSINEPQCDQIRSGVDSIIDFSGDKDVRDIIKIENHDIVKNVLETLVFAKFYESDLLGKIQTDCRIFKISGRYELTDDFDLNLHFQAGDAVVIRGPFASQFPISVTGNMVDDNFQYMSRLYSFPKAMIGNMAQCYSSSLSQMIQRNQVGGYIDIEHCLYKYLDRKRVINPVKIGISGALAPNGVLVSD
jgi:hypothetical protein